MFKFGNVENVGILRGFFNFWSWQHPKRSNSARRLQKWKLRAKLAASCQCLLRFFHSICLKSKVLHLRRNSEARSYEVPCLSSKIILANLQIWCTQMKSAPWPPSIMSLVLRLPREMHLRRSSWNAPRLPTLLKLLLKSKTPTFCSHLGRWAIPRAGHTKRRFNVQKKTEHVVSSACLLPNVLRATTACTFWASERPNVVRMNMRCF